MLRLSDIIIIVLSCNLDTTRSDKVEIVHSSMSPALPTLARKLSVFNTADHTMPSS